MTLLDAVYGVGLIQGLILSVILLSMQTSHRLSNVFMAFFSLSISLIFIQRLMGRMDLWGEFQVFAMVLPALRYAWGPLLFLYACSLTGKQIKLLDSLHFLPLLSFFLSANIVFWQLDSEHRAAVISYIWGIQASQDVALLALENIPQYHQFWISNNLSEFGLPLHMGFYCWLVLKRIQFNNRRLKKHFSSLDKMNLRWLKLLTSACVFYLAAMLFLRIFSQETINNIDPVAARAIILVCILYGIVISAIFQPGLITGELDSVHEERIPENKVIGEESQEFKTQKYQNSSINMEEAQSFKIKLMTAMQDQKLYLDSDLTLPQLADAAGLSTNHASQVINGQMNQNFYSFVNDYRIKMACELLSSPDTANMPIVSLAFEVGFKSKSSFYDAFKRATDMTPIQYKKKAQLQATA